MAGTEVAATAWASAHTAVLALWVASMAAVVVAVTFAYCKALVGFFAGRRVPRGRWTLTHAPRMSVVLPVYNEPAVIDRLVGATVGLDYPAYEVVVIDDSDDGITTWKLRAWQRRHSRRPVLKVVRRKGREGFKGGALQASLKHLNPRSSIMVVLDADAVPPRDLLWRFAKAFSRWKGAAAIQGRQSRGLNSTENVVASFASACDAVTHRLWMKASQWAGGFLQLTGSVFAIRLDALREVGGFRESLAEDLELSYRLRTKGYRVVYDDSVYAEGECPSTFWSLVKRQMRHTEGAIREFKRHFPALLKARDMRAYEKVDCTLYAVYSLAPALALVSALAYLALSLLWGFKLGLLEGLLLAVYNGLAAPTNILLGAKLDRLRGEALGALLAYPLFVGLAFIPLAFAALRGAILQRGAWFRTEKTGRALRLTRR